MKIVTMKNARVDGGYEEITITNVEALSVEESIVLKHTHFSIPRLGRVLKTLNIEEIEEVNFDYLITRGAVINLDSIKNCFIYGDLPKRILFRPVFEGDIVNIISLNSIVNFYDKETREQLFLKKAEYDFLLERGYIISQEDYFDKLHEQAIKENVENKKKASETQDRIYGVNPTVLIA